MQHYMGHKYIKRLTRMNVATITEEPLSTGVARIASTHSGDLKDANNGLQAPSPDLFYVSSLLYLSLTLLSHSRMARRLRPLRDFCSLLICLSYSLFTPSLKLDKPDPARSCASSNVVPSDRVWKRTKRHRALPGVRWLYSRLKQGK